MKNIKDTIKYVLSLITLLALFICVGNMVMAEEKVVAEVDEIEIIEAEDIGIKEIEKIQEEVKIPETPVNEATAKDKAVDVPVQTESEKVKQDEIKHEEEVESPEPPEGMVAGYEEDTYFEPNCFECELAEECYVCEECNMIEELCIDEEINPNGEHWVLFSYCDVCGNGGCEPVDDNFVSEFSGN